jgi:hypothetical protein
MTVVVMDDGPCQSSSSHFSPRRPGLNPESVHAEFVNTKDMVRFNPTTQRLPLLILLSPNAALLSTIIWGWCKGPFKAEVQRDCLTVMMTMIDTYMI